MRYTLHETDGSLGRLRHYTTFDGDRLFQKGNTKRAGRHQQ